MFNSLGQPTPLPAVSHTARSRSQDEVSVLLVHVRNLTHSIRTLTARRPSHSFAIGASEDSSTFAQEDDRRLGEWNSGRSQRIIPPHTNRTSPLSHFRKSTSSHFVSSLFSKAIRPCRRPRSPPKLFSCPSRLGRLCRPRCERK